MSYKSVRDKLEPSSDTVGVTNDLHAACLASIAISLKRLADAADRPQIISSENPRYLWRYNPATGELRRVLE